MHRTFLALIAMSAAALLPAQAASSAPAPADDLAAIERHLRALPSDPLAAFQLSLGVSRSELAGLLPVRTAGRLKAGPDTYDHLALHVGARKASLERAGGLSIVDGDFFFVSPGPLVEATLAVRATGGTERAIETLERALGTPEFEVVLPGALDLVLGWRAPGGYVIATFGDIDLFHLSAFPERPDDLVAGTQIVLFEGFATYARKIEAGSPRAR